MTTATATKKRETYHTEMAATFAVASQLSRRGYDVGITVGNSPRIDLLCSARDGVPFKVQVKGSSDKTYLRIQKRFFEASKQQDLFLIVALVPPPDGASGISCYVLSHEDAIREWNGLPATRKDGAPWAESMEGGLYWKNIEPYKDQWGKLPVPAANN